jgi:hypothetical protein
MLFRTEKLWRPCLLKAVDGEGGPVPRAEDLKLNRVMGADPSQPSVGVIGELSRALASGRVALSNVLDLISLEARRASIALIWMVVLAVVAAICIAVAWLGLMAALTMGAVSLGLTSVASVIAVASINLLVGAILIKVSIGISRDLLFSATRRQIVGKSPVPPSP